jgi:cytoskeletal protein CcmA (bactofilin family)
MNEIKTPVKKGASFLSEGLIVHGNISGDGDMRISGNIHGEVNLKSGHLIVEESGYIEGDINVKELTVAGWVKGKISTAERVEIATTGKVEGSIATPSIRILPGATLNGEFNITKQLKSELSAKLS